MPSLLVIDDEQEVTGYLQEYFKRRGVEVLAAANGEEGLALLRSANPGFVLLDVRLGKGLSGLDVLRQAREEKAASEIIMLTALEDTATAETAKSLGAADYITKPFILEELERVVLSRLKI